MAEFPALFSGTQRPVRCGELPESAFETIGNILASTRRRLDAEEPAEAGSRTTDKQDG